MARANPLENGSAMRRSNLWPETVAKVAKNSCTDSQLHYIIRMLGVSPKPVMSIYQPLVVVFAAVSVGIILDHYVPIALWIWLPLALISIAAWHWQRMRGREATSAALLLLSLACLGGAWHHRAWYLFAADDLGLSATAEPLPIVVEAIAQSKPQRMPAPPANSLRAIELGDRTRVNLTITGVRDGAAWRPASGNSTLVVNGHLFHVLAGDRIRLYGDLVAPSPAQNPGEFDYADFSRGNRVLSFLRCGSPQCVEVLESSSNWQPRRWVDAMRSMGEATLWRFISPKNAGLAAAMFLGLREELDPERMNAFRETGTIHLLVISGLNVGILATCVLVALRTGWLSNRMAMVLLVCITVMYAIITDAQPPVVRATVLVTVFCFAQLLGRQAIAFNTLAAAALLVLLINPVELFRPGTQLSFLAVATLIAIGQSWLTKPNSATDALVLQALPARNQLVYLLVKFIWQATLVSFVVWIVVQPLVAARFNLISPSAIVLGPILAVPVALAMASGFAVMLFGWLLPPLGALCGLVCDLALTFIVATVETARDAPAGKYWTAGPSDWWLAGFYGLLAIWILVPGVRLLRRRLVVTVAVGWCVIGLTAILAPAPVIIHFVRHFFLSAMAWLLSWNCRMGKPYFTMPAISRPPSSHREPLRVISSRGRSAVSICWSFLTPTQITTTRFHSYFHNFQ